MSQVNSYDRESYTTNGVAKSFSFGWNVNSKDDVKIQFVNAKGEIVNSAKFIDANDDEYTTSTYNFTVELNRQGGQIVFVDTPAEDQYLIIYRQTPLVYENSFKTATAFPAAAIDAAYRKIWLAIQEISADSLYNTLRLTPDQRGTVLGAFSEDDNNSLIYYDSVGNKLTYANFKVQDIEDALILVERIPSIAGDASEALNKANNAITIANNAKAEAQLARQDASNALQIATNIDAKAQQALDTANAAYQATRTYVHDQAVAATVWTITHNLDKHPSIDVVDTGGNIVTGKYSYPDNNTMIAEFNAAFKGTAYLN